jgi:predicted alpha/beta superfamily hydrolase
MKSRVQILFSIFIFVLAGCQGIFSGNEAKIVYHNNFTSGFVSERNIEVWLPPKYDPRKEYDVIYIHDGQNVFNAETSYGGVAWEMDSTMNLLIRKRKIIPAIVVAIWNSPDRFREYMPFKPREPLLAIKEAMGIEEELLSDNYLKFIVKDLKPFIDENYGTKKDPANTFIMGSSMGGLISLYAVMEYPEIFGGAACVSTHWPAVDGIFIEYLPGKLPNPTSHKLYFDHGTINLDSLYQPLQERVDMIVAAHGFTRGQNWLSLQFEGADHNEASWRDRLHEPLLFLLGKGQD